MAKRKNSNERSEEVRFRKGISRAFGGAIIFSLPLLMTMEMWQLGFYMNRLRLALLLIFLIPLLMGLAHKIGFKDDFNIFENFLEAFTAFAIGFITAVLILYLFSVIKPGMSFDEVIGKISLQAVPGSIGALLARTQLGGEKVEGNVKNKNIHYGWEIFLMGIGALFLSFNLAPTEEMVIISFKINEWHALGIFLLSIIVMHAFVYKIEFHGQEKVSGEETLLSVFLRYTIVGYALVLLISCYVLWTFGRTDGMAFSQIIIAVIILSFPGAIGAAAARLII